MGMSKTEAMKELERSTISHQQALVNKIEGTSNSEVLKRTIPGGKTLLDTITRESLPKAVYTWLRHCAYFTTFTVSFAKDTESEGISTKKILEFNSRSSDIEWDIRGKRWLAEKVAENLLKENVIAVSGKRDGLYIHITKAEINQDSDNWEPYVEFTPFRPRDLV